MVKRHCVNFIRCLCLWGMMLFLMGCSQTTATQGNDVSEKKKGSMHLTYNTEYPAIPPIDAAAPSHFETASFGLG